MTIRALSVAGLLLLAGMPFGRPASPPAVAPAGEAAARGAIERGLTFLEKDGDSWMEGRSHLNQGNGCVSCHVVTFAVWSHNEAKRGGVAIAQERIDDLTERAARFLARPRKGRPVSWGQLLLARDLAPAGVSAERWPDFRQSVMEMQKSEGYWEARGQFPSQRRPRIESDAVATMWTVLALASFDNYDDGEVEGIGNALDWISSSEPGESTEWVLGRMLLEHRLGKPDERREFRDALLGRQNPDGGWGFLAGEPSDAMTTGQVLYALARVGEPAESTTLQKATAYLLSAQQADGTWLVPSGLISRSADEAKDYVYKYWGTAWATIGLSRSLVAG